MWSFWMLVLKDAHQSWIGFMASILQVWQVLTSGSTSICSILLYDCRNKIGLRHFDRDGCSSFLVHETGTMARPFPLDKVFALSTWQSILLGTWHPHRHGSIPNSKLKMRMAIDVKKSLLSAQRARALKPTDWQIWRWRLFFLDVWTEDGQIERRFCLARLPLSATSQPYGTSEVPVRLCRNWHRKNSSHYFMTDRVLLTDIPKFKINKHTLLQS